MLPIHGTNVLILQYKYTNKGSNFNNYLKYFKVIFAAVLEWEKIPKMGKLSKLEYQIRSVRFGSL